jgi:hypothetical protein
VAPAAVSSPGEASAAATGGAVVGAAAAPGYRVRLGLWLPAMQFAYLILVWPLVYARGIVPADLATGPVVEPPSFLLNRLFFPAAAALALVVLVAERRRLAGLHLAGLVFVGGLFGYLGLTALWALAPAVTLSKYFLLAMQVVALLPAVLVARRVDDVLMPLFWVATVTIAVNLVAVVVLPTTPIGHPGIYSHKNTLGLNASLGGLFVLYGLSRAERRVRVVAAAALPVVFVLLVLSQSKTSLGLIVVAPAIAAAAVLLRRTLRISLAVFLVAAAGAGGFLLGGAVPGVSFREVSQVVSGDDTFTGRVDVWRFALTEVAERPFAGYGYQSFWGTGPDAPAAKLPDGFVQRTPHAHNGYLDLLLQGGAVALTLFVLTELMVAWWIDRLIDRDAGLGLFAAAVLLYMLLQNLLETDWLQGLSGSSLVVTLWCLLAAVRRDRRLLT